MPVLKIIAQQYAVPKGGVAKLGAGADADVRLSDDLSLGVQAILETRADGRVVIRPAGAYSSVRLNGVPLTNPTPLEHGDIIAAAGREALFTDEEHKGRVAIPSPNHGITMMEVPVAEAPRPTGAIKAPGAVLDVTEGPNKGQSYDIVNDTATIGRGQQNDVVIPSGSVSRAHAKLECRKGEWFITDLNSTNGTHVDGARVTGERKIGGMVSLRFGDVKVLFRERGIVVPPEQPSTGVMATPAQGSR